MGITRTAAVCLALSPAALAMAQAVIPGGAQPGQVEQPFQRPPAPRAAPLPDFQLGPRALPPDQASQIRFTVRDISVEGATAISADRLSPLTTPLIGKEVALTAIYDLADRITALYRNDGFLLTRVVVPEQRITDGRVRLVTVEGYIDKVVIQGTAPGRQELLQAYADKIKASRPLRAEVLERYLLLMNDLPGSSAQATLRASTSTPGAADLVIDYASRPVDAYVEINNRGSRALGPGRVEAELDLNSPLKRFDILRLNVASTFNDELRLGSLNYEYPIGTEGMLAAISATVARTHPQITGADIHTESKSAQFRMSYPFKRSRAENLYGRATLSWLDGNTDVAALPVSNDKVRSVRVGMSYDLSDRWLGVNFLDLELAQGLDVGGATKSDAADSSRPGATPTFTRLALYAARVQSLLPQFEMLVATNGQLSPKKLFPSEQFAFGGTTFGRGYDSAELLGDYGAAAKFELRYLGRTRGADPLAYTVYGFYDIGKVWRRDPAGQPGSISAASTGLGVRFNVVRNVSGYVEVAQPLTRQVALENNRHTRVFAAARWTF